jgi:hypothetical protein
MNDFAEKYEKLGILRDLLISQLRILRIALHGHPPFARIIRPNSVDVTAGCSRPPAMEYMSLGKSNTFFHPGTPHPSLNPPPLFSVYPFPLPFILLHSRVPNTRKPSRTYSGPTSPHPTQGCPTFNPPNRPPPRPRSIPDLLLPQGGRSATSIFGGPGE